ncbi:hypothetical protein AVEN_161068-1 [Araneus ventricosus]|uniref:Uncharacterized protein n=1 Tax=Araneus ventricosus TaxID=182803 RepID=A0A4Y2DZG9_ARAVE|nr:hypothetical protein AVEN_161068-1 [Araneus ventricosus]
MIHELDSPSLGGHLPTTPTQLYSLQAHEKGLWLARIIGHPTALSTEAISEPYLPSKEAYRLRPAFGAVKGKILDRFARCKRVNPRSHFRAKSLDLLLTEILMKFLSRISGLVD